MKLGLVGQNAGRLVTLEEVAALHPRPARRCECRGTGAIRLTKDASTGRICVLAKERFLAAFRDAVASSPEGPRWRPGRSPEESLDIGIRLAHMAA